MLEHHKAATSSHVGTEHVVQLFDSGESAADAISAFLEEGFILGDRLLAVMDEQRWYSVAMNLCAQGMPVDDALQSGRLTVRDATETLKLFMRSERPDPVLFARSVGTLVSRLAASGPLRVYGEMVDVLAAQGDYAPAYELEELWNELGRRHTFTLFCGYTAAHFGNPRNAASLRRICAAHSCVQSDQRDVLGSFLLRTHTAA